MIQERTKEVFSLKDTWNANREDMEVKGDILRLIEGVTNVPTLVCYGDVGDGSNFDHAYISQTDRYRIAEWNAHPPVISRALTLFCQMLESVHYDAVI